MNIRSCKAKGRRCAVEVKELLHKYAPDLEPGDIEVTSASVTGEDIKLSPAARFFYPLIIECKNTEALNIWKALAQAESHQSTGDNFKAPVVFFKRNRSKLYVALDAEHFIKLMR